jgi:hypothetical protein
MPNNSFSYQEVVLLNEPENCELENIVSPDHSTLRIGLCIEFMLEKRIGLFSLIESLISMNHDQKKLCQTSHRIHRKWLHVNQNQP